MKLFHRTTKSVARSILAKGFRDATGSYGMAGIGLTGVWVSNRPLDANEGADGDTLLQIELKLPRQKWTHYEIKEEGKPYREWCIPAKILNRGTIRRARE